MTDPTTQPAHFVRLNKLVQASPQQVYDTWLNAASYAKWFAPEPTVRCEDVSIDATVGGEMRVVMQSDNGMHTGIGTFTELIPAKRIAYTWGWLEHPEMGAGSTVIIDLIEADNPYGEGPATEIILTHQGLNTPMERSEHTGGWFGCLKALGYFVRGIDPREAMYGKPAKA